MRPIRMSLALAAAPFFEKAILAIMERTGITNKIAAFTVMLLFIAVATVAGLCLTIFACGGFLF